MSNHFDRNLYLEDRVCHWSDSVGIFVPFELPDQLQLLLRVVKEAPDLDLAAKELSPLLVTLLRWSVVVVVNPGPPAPTGFMGASSTQQILLHGWLLCCSRTLEPLYVSAGFILDLGKQH
jgi:hypothetical protein